jgi:hypothetical protein
MFVVVEAVHVIMLHRQPPSKDSASKSSWKAIWAWDILGPQKG